MNRHPNSVSREAAERRRTTTTKKKVSRRKKIIRIRAEINEREMKETIAEIDGTRGWLFEKINRIDRQLARLNKKKKK